MVQWQTPVLRARFRLHGGGKRRVRLTGRAERQRRIGVEGAAERGEHGVFAGAGNQHQAERRAVGAQRRRHCERAKVRPAEAMP